MVHVTTAFETTPGLSFICDKADETRTQKGLKTCFLCLVADEIILLERGGEEALG